MRSDAANGHHEANIQRKAHRAVEAIAKLIQIQIAQPGIESIVDEVTGWAYWRHALVALNSDAAWSAISFITGDEKFETSRADIFAGIERRAKLAAMTDDELFDGLA